MSVTSDSRQSGRDSLATLFYILARDHLTTGTIESILAEHIDGVHRVAPTYSSPQLASLAAEWASRVLGTDAGETKEDT